LFGESAIMRLSDDLQAWVQPHDKVLEPSSAFDQRRHGQIVVRKGEDVETEQNSRTFACDVSRIAFCYAEAGLKRTEV
jgi:hypothetical protein